MTRLTLLLFVDALRHDYVERMPFVASLAASGVRARLREDFGFLPRAAYFGGLSTSDYGFTNMFCCDPVRSPFGLARGLPQGRISRETEEVTGVRKWLDQEARRRATPFAAAYLSSFEIPLELVGHFDLVEKRAPWDCRIDYPSIFSTLRARREHWFTCAWPETNLLADHSDDGIVATTIATLRPPHRLAFIHLQELDGLGHTYGPESSEIDRALLATDARVRDLVTEIDRRFDAVDLVLFGDHGMVSVTGTVDVWSALQRVKATPGRDYVFFLDSTMARFWFQTTNARREVMDALAGLAGGRVLDAADLAALDLDGCDPRNGELYFFADPGVVVAPNFFQRRGPAVRGMHGYHPDCPDNQAFFLVRPHGGCAPASAGVVRPTAVYEHARHFLGLGPAPARLASAAPVASDPVFTAHPDPAANALVTAQLATLVAETRAVVPDATSIVLTGSFGRGEGGVASAADGSFRPVNDYDVLIVAPDPVSADLDALGRRLASAFGLDFVHFSTWRAVDPALPMTLAHFDLVRGHQVLYGDPHALETLPRLAAADLPVFEAVQLLLNRMAGLLTGVRGPFTSPGDLPDHERRYLRTQTMKALMALGDARLMRWQAYACSYRVRRDRLAWLGPGAGLDADETAAILRAYDFKLHPVFDASEDLGSLAARTSRWLLEAFVEAAGHLAARAMAGPTEAANGYYDVTTADTAVVAADNTYCATRLAGQADYVRMPDDRSIRQSIYAALPLLLAASHGDAAAFAAATSRLNACLAPSPADLTATSWDLVRRRATSAWLTLVH